MNQLPPEPKPDELSVREKAVEVATGVFVTKMATRAIRLGGQVVPAVNFAGFPGLHESKITEYSEPSDDARPTAEAERVAINALTALPKAKNRVAKDAARRAGKRHQ